MLPDDVWDSYYDRPCDICDEEIRVRHEDEYQCEQCNQTMCEECVASVECHVCKEALEENEDYDGVPDICPECMVNCDKCNVSFHPSCAAGHLATCHPAGRSLRKLKAAKAAVKANERGVRLAKRKLRELELELTHSITKFEMAKKKHRKRYH